MDYNRDVSIDPTILDVEWLRQARLTFDYGALVAENKRICDQEKERLDIVRAEMERTISNDPEKYGISKPTVAAVTAATLVSKEYQEASSDYLSAKYELDMSNVALRAIETKKSALENLVKLHGQSYFAGPKIPHDINKEWLEQEQQTNSNRKVVIKKNINQ